MFWVSVEELVSLSLIAPPDPQPWLSPWPRSLGLLAVFSLTVCPFLRLPAPAVLLSRGLFPTYLYCSFSRRSLLKCHLPHDPTKYFNLSPALSVHPPSCYSPQPFLPLVMNCNPQKTDVLKS